VTANSPKALSECRGPGADNASGKRVVLRAAFAVSGATYLGWQQSFHRRRAEAIAKASGTSAASIQVNDQSADAFAQNHRSDAVVYVCYFDGDFPTPLPIPPPPPFNRRIVEVAANGETATFVYGYHDVPGQATLPLERPS
jgi:hypothetical protein